MDTPKPGKNRIHLDLNVSGGPTVLLPDRKARVNREVGRLLDLGASEQRAWDVPPRSKAELGEYWVVMQDPEGNEFCVQ
jgi:hypothetical protein